MISTSRAEALATARRLARGFAGAPDPRRHAQQFYAVLIHAEGWTKPEQALIVALGAWLQERPGVGALKVRCDAALAQLL